MKRVKRVKLINLPDQAQAVVQIRDDKYLQMTIYGYDSRDKGVQFIAPFDFDSQKVRDQTFANVGKLRDFANAVFKTQMSTIDPDLNTENF